MSSSAILPITGSTPNYDFASATATASQQTVFNNVLTRFESAISTGDTSTIKTLLNTLTTLSPSSASSASTLGTLLASVGKALDSGSVAQAQAALKTYQNTQSSAPSTPSTGTNNSTTASTVAANLIQNQLHQQLVKALLAQANDIIQNAGSSQSSKTKNATNPFANLIDIIHTVYGTGNSSSSSTSSASGTTSPYDALVASLQASLNSGNGTLTPALAYLQAIRQFRQYVSLTIERSSGYTLSINFVRLLASSSRSARSCPN